MTCLFAGFNTVTSPDHHLGGEVTVWEMELMYFNLQFAVLFDLLVIKYTNQHYCPF